MLQAGNYYTLRIKKFVPFGAYLDGEGEEILLPNRYVPQDAKEGDTVEIFLYHDNESRRIATTDKPLAVAGEIALLNVVSVTQQGAFLEWGIMKDLFLPLSQQVSRIYKDRRYLVYLYVDTLTGRMAATEKFEKYLSNETLTVREKEAVQMLVWQQTDIGYKVIINSKHTGVLHFGDVFRELEYGEKITGYVKTIRPENKIDVAIGARGYQRIGNEAEQILALLQQQGGSLPYNDQSAPAAIYEFFGISKKAFKMALGALYKQRKITLTDGGIRLLREV